MKVKWYDSVINEKLNQAKEAYLHSIGQAMTNQLAVISPVKGGLLRNSMHYVMPDGEHSEFGQYGGNTPEGDEILSSPAHDKVRCGSAVIYADRVNKVGKSAGYFNRGVDYFRASGSMVELGKRVFRKFFG